MSSERAGGLNRDWLGRADVLRSYGGELDQDMVDQLDRAHTPSERAGTPTHGAEELAERYRASTGWEMAEGHAITDAFLAGYQAVHTSGALNREAARAMVAAEFPGSTPSDRLLDALEACVVPDPRIEDSAAYRAGVQAVLDRARAEAGFTGLVSLRGLENEFDE